MLDYHHLNTALTARVLGGSHRIGAGIKSVGLLRGVGGEVAQSTIHKHLSLVHCLKTHIIGFRATHSLIHQGAVRVEKGARRGYGWRTFVVRGFRTIRRRIPLLTARPPPRIRQLTPKITHPVVFSQGCALVARF